MKWKTISIPCMNYGHTGINIFVAKLIFTNFTIDLCQNKKLILLSDSSEEKSLSKGEDVIEFKKLNFHTHQRDYYTLDNYFSFDPTNDHIDPLLTCQRILKLLFLHSI